MVGPSTNRERATLEILKRTLSGYSVYPHMRLANVVKGRTQFKRAMSQYEIDFTVLDMEGEVVCVIELDDPTHDTADGMRRDLNKNTWLREADIPIIRIREPQEAMHLKDKVSAYAAHEFKPTDSEPRVFDLLGKGKAKPIKLPKEIISLITLFIVGPILIFFVLPALPKIGGKLGAAYTQKLTHDLQQSQQKAPQQRQQQLARERQQQLDRLEAERYQQAHQPHYERVFVKGKSAAECGHLKGTALDNNAVTCMNDHYETVLINGNQ